MPTYEIKAVFHCIDNITIEADSEKEAREKFNSGDYDGETTEAYDLHEIIYVREAAMEE